MYAFSNHYRNRRRRGVSTSADYHSCLHHRLFVSVSRQLYLSSLFIVALLGGVAHWLGRQSFAGGLSLTYA